jgi:pSer/pThr/pTyr-binding forkhead associated (FHA) protein
MRLFKLRDGEEHPALVLGGRPLRIGRSPRSDLVLLREPTVSTEHATVWLEAGKAHIRDLGSRNGTWVNGTRVREALLHDGDKIDIGTVRLIARGSLTPVQPSEAAHMLEDVDADVRYPFVGDRLIVGPSAVCDVHVTVEPDEEVAIWLHDDSEILLSGDARDQSLELDETFSIGARQFRVVYASVDRSRTQDLAARRPRYRLSAVLDARTGPRATLQDLDRAAKHTVTSETRATLLYLLVKARLDPDDTRDGWLSDSEAGVGIWGRQGGHDARKLHVLIHRLRKELRAAGFDPWFIEKRRRAVRVALSDVVVS